MTRRGSKRTFPLSESDPMQNQNLKQRVRQRNVLYVEKMAILIKNVHIELMNIYLLRQLNPLEILLHLRTSQKESMQVSNLRNLVINLINLRTNLISQRTNLLTLITNLLTLITSLLTLITNLLTLITNLLTLITNQRNPVANLLNLVISLRPRVENSRHQLRYWSLHSLASVRMSR